VPVKAELCRLTKDFTGCFDLQEKCTVENGFFLREKFQFQESSDFLHQESLTMPIVLQHRAH
jgi:hypothetical protein